MRTLSGSARGYSAPLKSLLQRSATLCSMTVEHWETLAQVYGDEVYSEALYRMSRLDMPAAEAKDCLLAVIAHQKALCASLGRNVSLLTSMCDYFMQVKPVLREPILVEVRLLQQKEESAYKDELTGLYNRRYFNEEIPKEMERFRRFGHGFALLMLDLDHFKAFNDTHGHSAGDQALRDTAAVLGDSARLYDRVVRYGGEEFAVILPQSGDAEAFTVAERIRAAMQLHHVRYAAQDLGGLTVSTGLASFPKDGLDVASLVQHADMALYKAKEQRNCVRAYRDSQRTYPRYLLSDPLPLALATDQAGWRKASAQDISFGGMLCESRGEPPHSDTIRLELSDESRGVHLPLEAEIRRVQDLGGNVYRLGLSFRIESLEDQRKLLTLLEGRVKSQQVRRMGPCGPEARA
jgi:diguanylate cyclase (GGDEF)-like protein